MITVRYYKDISSENVQTTVHEDVLEVFLIALLKAGYYIISVE